MPKKFVKLLEAHSIKDVEAAKGGYYCKEFLKVPQVLLVETLDLELFLLIAAAKTFNDIAVVDGISSGIVPATILGGKREVFLLQTGAVGDDFDCTG